MIDINAFLKTLPVMAYGMGGIFVVIVLIYFIIKGMCKIFKKSE